MEETGIKKSLRGESLSWREERKLASLRYMASGNLSNDVMAGFQLTNVFQCCHGCRLPAPWSF